MSRSYEAFREHAEISGEIDWHARGIRDAEWQDAEDSEPPTEPRFFTPAWFVPVIPPVVKEEGYNAFSSMTEEEIEQFKLKEK